MPDSSIGGFGPDGVCPRGGGAGLHSALSAPGKMVAASSGGIWPTLMALLGWAGFLVFTGWLGWVSPRFGRAFSSSEEARRRKRRLAPSPEFRLLRGERPNPSVISTGTSCRARRDQRSPGTFHQGVPSVIFHFQDNYDRTTADARDGFGLFDLCLHMNSVADIDGFDELPFVHFAEGHHRAFHEAGLHQQPGGDG